MIRKRLIEISDEEFLKITEPHNNAIDDYIETILYDYVAYYIAKGYELSALWESSLKSHVHSAINTFEGIKFIKDYDYYSYLDNSPTENTEQDNIDLINKNNDFKELVRLASFKEP